MCNQSSYIRCDKKVAMMHYTHRPPLTAWPLRRAANRRASQQQSGLPAARSRLQAEHVISNTFFINPVWAFSQLRICRPSPTQFWSGFYGWCAFFLSTRFEVSSHQTHKLLKAFLAGKHMMWISGCQKSGELSVGRRKKEETRHP